MSDYRQILKDADAIARKAAATLMSMREERLDVTRKEGLDIVTAADLASERIVIDGCARLRRKLPSCRKKPARRESWAKAAGSSTRSTAR